MDFPKGKKHHCIPDFGDLKITCSANEVISSNQDISDHRNNCDTDYESKSSSHKKKKRKHVSGENLIDTASHSRELESQTIIVTKKNKKKTKSQSGSMETIIVKKEFPEFVHSEDYSNNSSDPAKSTSSGYLTEEHDSMFGYGIYIEDEVDTNIQNFKVKKRKQKKHKIKYDIETDTVGEMMGHLKKNQPKEIMLDEHLINEPQIDPTPTKKRKKKRKLYLSLTEESNSESSPFSEGKPLKEEITAVTHRKRKKKSALKEWENDYESKYDKSISKNKKRRKVEDLSISNISNDYEQFIETELQKDPQTGNLKETSGKFTTATSWENIGNCDGLVELSSLLKSMEETALKDSRTSNEHYADTTSEELKAKKKKNSIKQKYKTEKIEIDLIEDVVPESESEPLPKKKSKKRKHMSQSLTEDIQLSYCKPEIDQSSRADSVDEELISTTPRKQKKNIIEYLNNYCQLKSEKSHKKKKKRLEDISVSSILNDEQCINTSVAPEVHCLGSESLQEILEDSPINNLHSTSENHDNLVTPRKKKKGALKEWDNDYDSKYEKSISKNKKRRKVGDLSISSILNDYEQCIETELRKDPQTVKQTSGKFTTATSWENTGHCEDLVEPSTHLKSMEETAAKDHITSNENDADTTRDKLKAKKNRIKQKNRTEQIETDIIGDVVPEAESEPLPKKKTKKKKHMSQSLTEDTQLSYCKPEIDQSSRAESVDEEIISTTRKQKKNILEYLNNYCQLKSEESCKQKKEDVSVSSILNDDEYFINTSVAPEVHCLGSESIQEILEESPTNNFHSTSKNHNATPIPQKHNKYYAIYNSDCEDYNELESIEKYMRGTILKDYRTSSDEYGAEVENQKSKKRQNIRKNGEASVGIVPSKTSSPAKTNGCNSFDYSEGGRYTPKNVKISHKGRDENVNIKKEEFSEEGSISIEENHIKNDLIIDNDGELERRKSSVNTNYTSDSNYSDEMTKPVNILSSNGRKKTILDYFKHSIEDGNSTSKKIQQSSPKKDKGAENANKKTKKSPVSISLQSHIEDNEKNGKSERSQNNQHSIHNSNFDHSHISTHHKKEGISSDSIGRRNSTLISEEESFIEEINHSKKDESTKNIRKTRDMKSESVHHPDEFEMETVRNLTIFLPFSVPPLHQNIRYRTPVGPSVEGIKVKYGAFSKSEDDTIMNNWKRFCEEHDLDVKPYVFFKFRGFKKEEKIKFLQYISHGIDDRLPEKVHIRFKKIYENMSIKKGRFSEAEDKEILRFMDKYGDSEYPFLNLAKILNRNSAAVLKRYETLKNADNNHKIIWDLDLSEKLVRRMMKVGKCDRVEDLENLQLSTEQWHKLSRKMGNMPLRKLQRGWKITVHPRLFSKHSILGVKRKIFHLLQERKENDWRTVNWAEIAEKFAGYTSEKVYNLFRTLVNFHVPKSKQTDLGECLKILKDSRIRRIKKFRRFIYKEGKLKYESESEED